VIVYAGGNNGFINDAKLVFLAKKNSADYHDEMDSERFEKWFQDQLLPNIRPGSVIIMDNAAYRSRKSELLPTTAWRKEDIKQWLLAKNIPFPDDSMKRELQQTMESVRSEYTSCVVDEMAEQRGVTLCRLPPYHCKLNVIELVWSQIKRHAAVHNTQFKAYFMNNLIDNAFYAVSDNRWANYCKHVDTLNRKCGRRTIYRMMLDHW
jgi:transposase